MRTTILSIFFLLSGLFLSAQTANYWVKKSDFIGSKRERAVSFSIGDYGYLATGVDTAEIVLKDLWQYDPLLDTWSQKADLQGSARRDAVGFSIGEKGYIAAGIDNNEALVGVKLKDLWQYDPSLNTWVQKADFPGAGGLGIYFATAFTIDSKGYICCGKKGPSVYSNELWEYKPSIDQWTQRSAFPGGVRYQLASFSIGNLAYVGLGTTQDIFKRDFWKYNPGTNTWSQIADLPGNERGSASAFVTGGPGFVCLGNDGGLLNDLWEYKPEVDAWFSRAPYGGSERKNAISFTVNERVFVGTGKGVSGKKASFYEYIPFDILGTTNLETSLNFYPNPSSDKVKMTSIPSNVQSIELLSSDGKIMVRMNVNNQVDLILHVTDYPNGFYYINLYADEREMLSSHRIIIQHL